MADDKKPDEKQNSDNLIPFPVDRVKKKQAAKSLAGKIKDKKVTLFVCVVAILLSAVLFNQYAFQDSRYIASGEGYVRDLDAEKRLASELSDPDNRGPASFGREPSAEDKLRSGDLQSRYQIVNENGHVVAIHLQPGVSNEPIYIKDRKEFLERYKRVIAPGFDSVEQVVDVDSNLTRESYTLKRGPASVGHAHFELDRSGAFYSLKVEVIK